MNALGLLGDGTGTAANATLLLLAAAFLGWLAVQRLRGKSLLRVPPAAAWVGVLFAVALAVFGLLLPSVVSPAPSAKRPATSATIQIVSPSKDQVFQGTTSAPAAIPVEIMVVGARIVPATSTRLRPDEGHVHLFLDGALVSMTAGTTASLDVGPGQHVLSAEFVASDHGPFDPRVQASVRFVVQP
jgi:hypothetical protein